MISRQSLAFIKILNCLWYLQLLASSTCSGFTLPTRPASQSTLGKSRSQHDLLYNRNHPPLGFYKRDTRTIVYASTAAKATEPVVETIQVQLSTGISAQVMTSKAIATKVLSTPSNLFASLFKFDNKKATTGRRNANTKPPLVFIHGSLHASWCWAEHYLPYFARLGYDTYALSLRGTGGTFAGEGVTKVKIGEHVEDLTSFLSYVDMDQQAKGGSATSASKVESLPPVLIAHSFGGMLVMKYLEKNLLEGENETTAWLSGVGLLCSVPPSGNGKMTGRFLKRSLVDSWKITAGLAMKKCVTNESLCRELFFGGEIKELKDGGVEDYGISTEDIKRYQGYFRRDTDAIIDLIDLAKQLPSVNTDSMGACLFKERLPPSLVVGAQNDFIVDEEGVIETAQYFGVQPTIVDSPHDVMLGARWETCAENIQLWLESNKVNNQ